MQYDQQNNARGSGGGEAGSPPRTRPLTPPRMGPPDVPPALPSILTNIASSSSATAAASSAPAVPIKKSPSVAVSPTMTSPPAVDGAPSFAPALLSSRRAPLPPQSQLAIAGPSRTSSTTTTAASAWDVKPPEQLPIRRRMLCVDFTSHASHIDHVRKGFHHQLDLLERDRDAYGGPFQIHSVLDTGLTGAEQELPLRTAPPHAGVTPTERQRFVGERDERYALNAKARVRETMHSAMALLGQASSGETAASREAERMHRIDLDREAHLSELVERTERQRMHIERLEREREAAKDAAVKEAAMKEAFEKGVAQGVKDERKRAAKIRAQVRAKEAEAAAAASNTAGTSATVKTEAEQEEERDQMVSASPSRTRNVPHHPAAPLPPPVVAPAAAAPQSVPGTPIFLRSPSASASPDCPPSRSSVVVCEEILGTEEAAPASRVSSSSVSSSSEESSSEGEMEITGVEAGAPAALPAPSAAASNGKGPRKSATAGPSNKVPGAPRRNAKAQEQQDKAPEGSKRQQHTAGSSREKSSVAAASAPARSAPASAKAARPSSAGRSDNQAQNGRATATSAPPARSRRASDASMRDRSAASRDGKRRARDTDVEGSDPDAPRYSEWERSHRPSSSRDRRAGTSSSRSGSSSDDASDDDEDAAERRKRRDWQLYLDFCEFNKMRRYKKKRRRGAESGGSRAGSASERASESEADSESEEESARRRRSKKAPPTPSRKKSKAAAGSASRTSTNTPKAFSSRAGSSTNCRSNAAGPPSAPANARGSNQTYRQVFYESARKFWSEEELVALQRAYQACEHVANLQDRALQLTHEFNRLTQGNRNESSVVSKAKSMDIFPKVRGPNRTVLSVPSKNNARSRNGSSSNQNSSNARGSSASRGGGASSGRRGASNNGPPSRFSGGGAALARKTHPFPQR